MTRRDVHLTARLSVLPRGLNPVACGAWYARGGVPVERDGVVIGETVGVCYAPDPSATWRATVDADAVADLPDEPIPATAVQGTTWPGPGVLRLILPGRA